MSETIERVARASFKAYCDRNGLKFKFEDMDDTEREFAMIHARACIEAMRKPTDAQRNAYYKLSHQTEPMFDAHWERAIDAALSE